MVRQHKIIEEIDKNDRDKMDQDIMITQIYVHDITHQIIYATHMMVSYTD